MYPTRPRRTLGRCNKSSELLRSIFRVHTQDLKRKNAAHTELSVASPFPSRWEVRSRLSIQSGRAAGSELQGMKVVSAPVTNDKHLHSQPTEETHRDTQRPCPAVRREGRQALSPSDDECAQPGSHGPVPLSRPQAWFQPLVFLPLG